MALAASGRLIHIEAAALDSLRATRRPSERLGDVQPIRTIAARCVILQARL